MSLRTDHVLDRFFHFLNSRHLGPSDVLIVFSADHGVAPLPEKNAERKMPGGRFSGAQINKAVQDLLSRLASAPGSGWFKSRSSTSSASPPHRSAITPIRRIPIATSSARVLGRRCRRLRQQEPLRRVVRRLCRVGLAQGGRRCRLQVGPELSQLGLGQLLRLGRRPRDLAPRERELYAPARRCRGLRAQRQGGHRRACRRS